MTSWMAARAPIFHEITAENADHPLFAGLPTSFSLVDEAYLMEVSKNITPVARTDVELTDRNLYSLKLAMTASAAPTEIGTAAGQQYCRLRRRRRTARCLHPARAFQSYAGKMPIIAGLYVMA